SFMSTVKRLEAPFVSLETGDYDWRRIAAGGSVGVGGGELTLVGQWKTYDGPWELEEDLDHKAAWGKYARETSRGLLELTLSGYHGEWRPTEQIPERAIGTDVCADEFCALDPTAVGETLRWIASGRFTAQDWRASVYVQHYDWHMLSNPTYDFQLNQLARRNIFGGRFDRTLLQKERLTFRAGAEGRYDDIARVGLQHTIDGVFDSDLGRYSVREGSIAPYAEASWTPLDALRVLAGVRADFY